MTLNKIWDKEKKQDFYTTRIRKEAIDPWTFLGTEDFKQVMNAGGTVNSTVLALGHTRAPTIGAVTKENAHPFSFSNVIGVHNGTIHGDFPLRKDFDTDSEALYALINSVGIEEALKEVDKFATSAYSLVFYDRKLKTLNFVRNDKRPMFLAWKDQKNTLFWASEMGMSNFVLNRRNVGLSKESGFTPFQVPVGELITFEVTNRFNWTEKYERKKLDLKKPTTSVYYNNQKGSWSAERIQDEVEHCAVTFPPSRMSLRNLLPW
jgi:hypothetical protein